MPTRAGFDTWARQYLAAAATDEYAWILSEHGWGIHDASADARRFGRERAGAFVEMICYVLSFRAMDRAGESPEWTRRFLGLQQYGQDPFDVGARYAVRVVGPLLSMSVCIDAMSDVDFEDLHSVGFWDHLELHAYRSEDCTLEHIASLFEALRADVAFGGDLDLRITEQDDWSFCASVHEVALVEELE